MKAIKTLLIGIMMLVSTAMVAQPMNYNAIRNNARFLTDRMAYTLGITNPMLIDDIYRINFDYIEGLNYYLDDIALGYRYDDYMDICAERDFALQMLLGDVMWHRLMAIDYYYRPIIFQNHRWHFGIYIHDHDRSFFHYSVPRYFADYRGGHFFGGMRPARGIGDRGPGMANWGPRVIRPRDNGNRGGGNMNPGMRDNGNRGGNMNPGMRDNGNRGGNVNPGMRDNGNHGGNVSPGTRTEANRGGSVSRGEVGNQRVDRGGSRGVDVSTVRTPGNINSSSRTSSYGGASRGGSVSTPSRSGGTFSGSRSSSFEGGSRSGGSSVGTSRSGSGSAGSASRGGNSGGGVRAGRR